MEGKITTLEEKINQTEEQLKDPEKYQELSKNPAFFKDYENMKDDLDKLMQQWEEIATKIEG